MRFHVVSPNRPRRIAKALRAAFGRRGIPMTLSSAQETVARMYGADDWHALVSRVSKQPSPMDVEVSTTLAAMRRSAQIAVLVDAGIPKAMAADVVDEIRPTGSRRSHEPLPALVVDVELVDRDGSARRFPSVDLTSILVEDLCQRGHVWVAQELRSGEWLVRLGSRLGRVLPQSGVGLTPRVHGLVEASDAFLRRVGDLGDPEVLPRLSRRLADVANERRWLASMETTRRRVSAAKVRRSAEGLDWVIEIEGYENNENEGHLATMRDAYRNWAWGLMEAEDAPHVEPWEENRRRRIQRVEEIVRDEAPPFVYATFAIRWPGVTRDQILELWREEKPDPEDGGADEEDEEIDVATALAERVPDLVLESIADEHHEDAGDDVEGFDVLSGIVREWCPHAETGDAVDLDLDRRLEEWNARQKVVSYRTDHGRVVPMREGVRRAHMLAWCDDEIVRRRERILELETWDAPTVRSVVGEVDAETIAAELGLGNGFLLNRMLRSGIAHRTEGLRCLISPEGAEEMRRIRGIEMERRSRRAIEQPPSAEDDLPMPVAPQGMR